jgi:hypothetical protein
MIRHSENQRMSDNADTKFNYRYFGIPTKLNLNLRSRSIIVLIDFSGNLFSLRSRLITI